MNDIIKELVGELLKLDYPITRMRIDKNIHYSIKTKGNFKRVIQIGRGHYRVSNAEQKLQAMYQLSHIMCRVFNISQEESLPIIKKYLHIK